MKENDEEDNNFQNKDISKKIPIDISEIKGEGKNEFCSNIEYPTKSEIQNLNIKNKKNEMKNVYNTNTYNINITNTKNMQSQGAKEIEDCYNDIKESISLKKELNINKSDISNINNNKNIESNIKILTYIWKSKMLFSGYYEFEILFTKKDVSNNKILAQRTMYREVIMILRYYMKD